MIAESLVIVAVVVIGAAAVVYQDSDGPLDALESGLTGALAVVFGTFAMTLGVLGDLGSLVADAPGVASSVVIGGVGSLGLAGYIDVAPQAFAFVALVAVVVALSIREAT